MAYIIVEDEILSVDTLGQCTVAGEAVSDAGLEYADVYAGDPGTIDSYRNGEKLYAVPRNRGRTENADGSWS